MKVIDGTDATLGRLASYAAKEALKGEEIAIINCNDILITGNKKNIDKEFAEKRKRIGSTQKGPKVSKDVEKIVKKTIRGMLPNYREGRGREAFKRIKCYKESPKEFDGYKKVKSGKKKKGKFIKMKEVSK